ncbi:hypothetical protein [Sphingomonas sp. BK580]|uniref:hypothetical protein n=1 Tax=Sphingomonas sp. BK580 TaxID=2586972 RepID=UPI00161F6D75|nr:hypothetical protein [Sphingomonas sp. BK580]MBB3692490.1 hypothetical protein [Sphingomonas sp. BK580]
MIAIRRRVAFFLVGFLVAVLVAGSAIAWVLWPGSPSLPTYSWQQTSESDFEPGGEACKLGALRRLKSDDERSRRQDECAALIEQHRISTNDLKQQTRAADAAAAAVWIAEWQSKATVFGLIVGLYTLAAAAAAAIFAKRAADEAKRSADAAERSILETQRIGEAQVRAYLSVLSVSILISSDLQLRAKLTYKNVGQSPARQAKIVCTASVAATPQIRLPAGNALTHYPETVSSSAPPAEVEFGKGWWKYEVRKPDRGAVHENDLRVNVIVTYVDVFGRQHEEAFRYWVLSSIVLDVWHDAIPMPSDTV